MTESRRVVHDPDAATTVALLRAPAAVVSAAFLAGLVAAEAAVRGRGLQSRGWDVLAYAIVVLVMSPFLLPSRWYWRGATLMRLWITGAAAAASCRAVYMSAALYSHRPAPEWLMLTGLYLVEAGTLWLAVFAVHRGPVPRRDAFGPTSEQAASLGERTGP
jgi:lysylphosphatidylglycerol synthetase-like protein (DUF2156 family)